MDNIKEFGRALYDSMFYVYVVSSSQFALQKFKDQDVEV
jgi:hypothetical protein